MYAAHFFDLAVTEVIAVAACKEHPVNIGIDEFIYLLLYHFRIGHIIERFLSCSYVAFVSVFEVFPDIFFGARHCVDVHFR